MDLQKHIKGVGPKLRALRGSEMWSLSDVSKITGISVATLSRLETGQRRPTLELLLPLAIAFDVPLEQIVGYRHGDRAKTARITHPFEVVGGARWQQIGADSRTFNLYRVTVERDAWGGVDPHHTPDFLPIETPVRHEGREWVYVEAGELTIGPAAGDREILLAVESAEYDATDLHALELVPRSPGVFLIKTDHGSHVAHMGLEYISR